MKGDFIKVKVDEYLDIEYKNTDLNGNEIIPDCFNVLSSDTVITTINFRI